MVVCVGMKLQRELINCQIDRHRVIERDIETLPFVHIDAGYLRVLRRNSKFLCFLSNVVANVFDTFLGVAGQREAGFALDGILKLIIREIHGNDFDCLRRPSQPRMISVIMRFSFEPPRSFIVLSRSQHVTWSSAA